MKIMINELLLLSLSAFLSNNLHSINHNLYFYVFNYLSVSHYLLISISIYLSISLLIFYTLLSSVVSISHNFYYFCFTFSLFILLVFLFILSHFLTLPCWTLCFYYIFPFLALSLLLSLFTNLYLSFSLSCCFFILSQSQLYLIISVSFPITTCSTVSSITFRFLFEIFDKLTERLKQINYLLTVAWTIKFHTQRTASAFACCQLQANTWQDISPSSQQPAINFAHPARQRPFICQNSPYTTAETSIQWKHHSSRKCSNAGGPQSPLLLRLAVGDGLCWAQLPLSMHYGRLRLISRGLSTSNRGTYTVSLYAQHSLDTLWEGAVGNVCFRPPQAVIVPKEGRKT